MNRTPPPVARRLVAIAAACLLAGRLGAQEPPALVLQAEQARIEAMARALKTAVAVFEAGGNGAGPGS